jgi:uncharacterized membrane protein
MPRLIVIAHESADAAKRALSGAQRLSEEGVLELKAGSVVTRSEDGAIHLSETADVGDRAATWGGAFWGGLLGLALGGPVLGAGIGAGLGRLSARRSDLGIPDDFQRSVAVKLPPGRAAAVILVEVHDPERALAEASSWGGELLETDLPPEGESELRKALERVRPE